MFLIAIIITEILQIFLEFDLGRNYGKISHKAHILKVSTGEIEVQDWSVHDAKHTHMFAVDTFSNT